MGGLLKLGRRLFCSLCAVFCDERRYTKGQVGSQLRQVSAGGDVNIYNISMAEPDVRRMLKESSADDEEG